MSIQAKIVASTIMMQGLMGCASEERLVFVTSTSLDIGYDATSGAANIGYNREEAVIGPHYTESGRVPPVYARLASNGGFFKAKVSQIYGTGKAAVIATRSAGLDCVGGIADEEPYGGNRKVLIFGTTTNIGLHVRYVQGAAPESVSLGFKRKEFSWVPLNRRQPDGTHIADSYPSLLARVELDYNVAPGASDSEFDIGQFIATGQAAENLACKEGGMTANTELSPAGGRAANPSAALLTILDSPIDPLRSRENGGP
ncbi:hypothetical protein [uncultured Lamprocystis sp.]|jgi:hypothetical protein|uniref:hypothetical protein n=1 Tax=uncultured Lamprocystis sp. TaxID=543132 RepID=UPI0025E30C4F|nr:hypothetical protein [uncultured Lamprocystis sp.]